MVEKVPFSDCLSIAAEKIVCQVQSSLVVIHNDRQGMRIGQLVLAVDHPWGQRGHVAAWLVSGLGTIQVERI